MRMFALLAALSLPFAVPATAALSPGVKAPVFNTRGAVAGKVIDINLAVELKKGPVVLYFFPAAFTSGCNVEAKAFADNVDAFRAAGATVIGMSADTVEQLQRFSVEHCAGKFAVASAGAGIINDYDVALGRQVNGRSVSDRTSYVIAPDGKIIYAHSDLSPVDHVRNTLKAVRDYQARAL